MILRTLFGSGIKFEGYIKIQCWKNEDNPTIYAEGNNNELDIPEEYMDKEISYIFPYVNNIVCSRGEHYISTAALCIELVE